MWSLLAATPRNADEQGTPCAKFVMTVFDDFVTTQRVLTATPYDALLATVDTLSIHVNATAASGVSPTLSIKVEHSGPGIALPAAWARRSASPPELPSPSQDAPCTPRAEQAGTSSSCDCDTGATDQSLAESALVLPPTLAPRRAPVRTGTPRAAIGTAQ